MVKKKKKKKKGENFSDPIPTTGGVVQQYKKNIAQSMQTNKATLTL